jgi:hypothetical protein
LFSTRDALLLSCANNFVASGTPLRAAKAFSERIVKEELEDFFRLKASVFADHTVMIFPRGKEWVMAFKSFSNVPEIVVEVLGVDGTFRSENLSKEKIPPAYFAFEPERFIRDVLQSLGEGFVSGIAEDHFRAADRLGKSR